VIDFARDIVEVDGEPRAKRGKLSGRKHLWGCPECGNRGISSARAKLGHCPRCGHKVRSLLDTRISQQKTRGSNPSPQSIRERVLQQIAVVPDPFGRVSRE
jgi:nicotinate phosphoribosyltransferase